MADSAVRVKMGATYKVYQPEGFSYINEFRLKVMLSKKKYPKGKVRVGLKKKENKPFTHITR